MDDDTKPVEESTENVEEPKDESGVEAGSSALSERSVSPRTSGPVGGLDGSGSGTPP